MKNLDITIAACLTSHALNIGYGPVVKKGVEALERDRIGHVDLNYLRPETYAAANVPLSRYNFVLPDLGGSIRELRDPDADDDDFGD